jgi:hypothetical protein
MHDVPVLMFSAVDVADRVRSGPQPAMQCKEGPCQDQTLLPQRALCENKGVDDRDRILWRCEFPEVPVAVDIPRVL